MAEKKTALVIMAAGIGSRFGGGIKQLEPVGPNGEIIMDYSIFDAIEAGFNKIVFIIRKDIEKDFREVIGERIEKACSERGVEIAYAFQDLHNIPAGVPFPEGRKKPWGTGQAVLACRGILREPFVTINADDYYGKEAYRVLYDRLQNYTPDHPADFCMAGFVMKNTLSDHGTVTRGICKVNEDHYLTEIVETGNILKTPEGASIDGTSVDAGVPVSMNMWGLTPEFLGLLEKGFGEFFERLERGEGDPLKAEYLLPIYIGELLEKKEISVKVLETKDTWFGVTYQEDKPVVVEAFRKLIDAGVYKEKLW